RRGSSPRETRQTGSWRAGHLFHAELSDNSFHPPSSSSPPLAPQDHRPQAPPGPPPGTDFCKLLRRKLRTLPKHSHAYLTSRTHSVERCQPASVVDGTGREVHSHRGSAH